MLLPTSQNVDFQKQVSEIRVMQKKKQLLELRVLAYKKGCMAWSARQGISIKHICVIQQKGYVTTISDQKCTVGRGNVRGVGSFNM